MSSLPFEIVPPQPTAPGAMPGAISERLPVFVDGPADVAARLAAAVATIIGVGSIGRAMAEQLTRIGVGTIQLIDRSTIKPQSLLTHVGVMPDDIGQPKARNAGVMCKRINPNVNIRVFDGDVADLPPTALLATDFALLASDNLKAEVHVSQLCAALGKPLIQLSVDGPSLLTHARVLANQPGGPCLRCLFNSLEEDQLLSDHRFPCDGGAQVQPTMSTANLCALAASIGVTLALRHILHLGEPLRDSLHEFCGYTFEASVCPIHRRADCPQQHVPWRIVRVSQPLADCSLAQLAASADAKFDFPLQVEIDRFTYVDGSIRRYMNHEASDAPLVHRYRRVPAELLADRADQPIATIVPSAPRWALLHGEGESWLVVEEAA